MARTDALKRLEETLLRRRDELRKRMSGQLADMAGSDSSVVTGDSADAAFESVGEELSSQLAEMEGKELSQINLAIRRIRQDRYGLCDTCGCKIPVARLNALPYSTMCVKCQREAESDDSYGGSYGTARWDSLRDGDEREVTISDLEADIR